MAIEIKDIFTAVGLEPETEFETIEDFNREFNKDFIKRSAVKDDKELADSILGKRIGSEEVDLKRSFKQLGIEFEPDELKGEDDKPIPLSEVRKIGFKKLKEAHEAAIKELKDNSTGDTDERIQELTVERDKLKKKADQLKEANNELSGTVEQQKKGFKSEINNHIINSEISNIKSGLTFKDGITDFERKGFESHIGDKFKFDIEEVGEGDNITRKVIVTDKEGNFIKNEKKAGEFLSPKDVIEQEAMANKLLKANGVEKPENKSTFKPQEGEQKVDRDDIITAKIHPAAAKAAEAAAAAGD